MEKKKKQLSTDRMIQIALGVAVVILIIVLIGKNQAAKNAWTIDGKEMATDGIMMDDKMDGEAMEEEKMDSGSTTENKQPASNGGGTTQQGAVTPNTNYASCKPGLSGEKSEELNAIILKWNPCSSGDFQFYKLVKSSIKEEPSYPTDPVAFSSANKNAANFIDKTVARATTYHYRLCVVERLNQVSCSNKVTVSY